MGKVGSLGGIEFYVQGGDDGYEMMSFESMTRESSARYEEHATPGKKPLLEFIGPEADQIKLTIVASEQYGVSPRKLQNKILKYENKGTACNFRLGGKRVGSYKWVITGCSATYEVIGPGGNVQELRLALTLKEYRYKKTTSVTVTSPTKPAASSASKSSKQNKSTSKSSTSYKIKKGDTLWGLAKKYYGSGAKYTKIYNANKNIIKDPNELQIGRVIQIPRS